MCGQWAIIIIVSILNFPLKQCDGLQNARVKTKFGRPGVHKIIIIIVHGTASTWEPNRLNVLMDFYPQEMKLFYSAEVNDVCFIV